MNDVHMKYLNINKKISINHLSPRLILAILNPFLKYSLKLTWNLGMALSKHAFNLLQWLKSILISDIMIYKICVTKEDI